MHFARIRLQPRGSIQRFLRQLDMWSRGIVQPMQVELGIREFAERRHEGRVATNRFVQQLDFTLGSFDSAAADTAGAGAVERRRTKVQVVGSHVLRRLGRDDSFFAWGKLGLKLLGNGVSDLTLDGEDIG